MRGACWWIDRWRKSTAYICMNLEEQGLYRNLLDAMWLFDGRPIPDDLKALVTASGGDAKAWKRSGPKVLQWMRRVEGGWVNDTALEIMASKMASRESQAAKGRIRAGGAIRYKGKFTSPPPAELPAGEPAGEPAGTPADEPAGAPAENQPPDLDLCTTKIFYHS